MNFQNFRPQISISRLTKDKKLAIKLVLVFGLFATLVSSFVAIADEVSEGDTLPYDNAILTGINHFSGPVLDRLFVVLTNLGGVAFVGAVAILLTGCLVYRRKKYAAIMILSSVSGSALVTFILKVLFERARPNLWDHLITEASFSFPSGHATASSALAFSIVAIFWYTKWRTLAIVLGAVYVIGIGLSRLYLGVHYPTDIIGGWLISLAWVVMVAALLYERSHRQRVIKQR